MPNDQAPHTFTKEDAEAEVALLQILKSECCMLGKHGASPWRRSAAARIEQHLDSLIPTTFTRLNLTA